MRLGVCVDTCHIFAAGYALETPEQYNETIECLDRAIGLGRVALWHLNDSVKGLGSRVDRHAAIGRGEIGARAFGHLLRDPRFASVPMVLETPKGVEDGLELDAINLATLRRLETAADVPTPISAEAPASAPPARRRTRKAPGNAG
jgi:deoxyribonuclease-4